MRSRLIAAALAVALVGAGTAVVVTRGGGPHHAPAATSASSPTRTADRVAYQRAQLDNIAGRPHAASTLHDRWDTTADRAERVRILEAAGHIPDPTGLQLLVEIATKADEPLAAQAAAAIGAMKNPRLARDLAVLAASQASPLVRANAARALGQSGTHEQAAVLAALVADGNQPLRVRQEAALALRTIGDDASAVALGQTLDGLAAATNDTASQLRISIVQALGGIRVPAAREALLRHRARSLSPTELAFVVRALGQLPQS